MPNSISLQQAAGGATRFFLASQLATVVAAYDESPEGRRLGSGALLACSETGGTSQVPFLPAVG